MSFPEFSTESNFNFHLKSIKELLDDTKSINQILDFTSMKPATFYKRRDKQGWWMVTKQIVIRHYIDEYLTILGKERRRFIQLYFIDLLSSFGLNKVTKSDGRDEFIFPGSSISAALISLKKNVGFKKIYANDIKLYQRKILNSRLRALLDFHNTQLETCIDIESTETDSNHWVTQILNEIKNQEKTFNYLMIIDNEGMNITYDTIKKIRDAHGYGDIIITFQDAGIKRNLKQNPLRVKDFFGIDINPSTKKEELCNIYINQLNKLGLANIQKLKVASKSGFYYTLLFCCRYDVEAKWLNMIEHYRDERFKNWTDSDVKKMWDVAKGRVLPLNNFF